VGVFGDAFLAGDVERAKSLLAPESRLHTPVATYIGPQRIGRLLEAIFEVLRNRRVTSELERGDELALFFSATIEGRPVDGVLHVTMEQSGRATEITVMVRPLEPLLRSVDLVRDLLQRR
jgi:hypothetical protein